MARFFRQFLIFGGITLLLISANLFAEVKLRIYLNDGSLRSGTLVSELEKSFVILSKIGRVEVPKKDIMFVNGKTLKQWEDRPDKFFQTEIMPSELPKNGFVNSQSLPEAPKAPPKNNDLKTIGRCDESRG